jgi:hypothetical protein
MIRAASSGTSRSVCRERDTKMTSAADATKPKAFYNWPNLYSQKGYWDRPRPPWSRAGAPSPRSIHTAVGQSLSYWEGIESLFAALFDVFVESKTGAASRAYGTVNSPVARRELLKYASEIFFSVHTDLGSFASEYEAISQSYNDASARRNDFAHGITVLAHGGINGHTGYFLVPSMSSSKKQKSRIELVFHLLHAAERYTPGLEPYSTFLLDSSIYAYNAELIQQYVRKFRQFNHDLNVWASALLSELDPKVKKLLEEVSLSLGPRPLL